VTNVYLQQQQLQKQQQNLLDFSVLLDSNEVQDLQEEEDDRLSNYNNDNNNLLNSASSGISSLFSNVYSSATNVVERGKGWWGGKEGEIRVLDAGDNAPASMKKNKKEKKEKQQQQQKITPFLSENDNPTSSSRSEVPTAFVWPWDRFYRGDIPLFETEVSSSGISPAPGRSRETQRFGVGMGLLDGSKNKENLIGAIMTQELEAIPLSSSSSFPSSLSETISQPYGESLSTASFESDAAATSSTAPATISNNNDNKPPGFRKRVASAFVNTFPLTTRIVDLATFWNRGEREKERQRQLLFEAERLFAEQKAIEEQLQQQQQQQKLQQEQEQQRLIHVQLEQRQQQLLLLEQERQQKAQDSAAAAAAATATTASKLRGILSIATSYAPGILVKFASSTFSRLDSSNKPASAAASSAVSIITSGGSPAEAAAGTAAIVPGNLGAQQYVPMDVRGIQVQVPATFSTPPSTSLASGIAATSSSSALSAAAAVEMAAASTSIFDEESRLHKDSLRYKQHTHTRMHPNLLTRYNSTHAHSCKCENEYACINSPPTSNSPFR